MGNDRDTPMPRPLADWLAAVNEASRAVLAQGLRRTVIGVREALDAVTRRFLTQSPPVALVRDEVIPGPSYPVPVRIYHPEPEQALPVALFVHGGGHVAGGVALYDPIARKLALTARHLVVAVEYRLAPECPYPAGLQDVMAAAKRVLRTLGGLGMAHQARLALIGDSGGGALCATLAHLSQYDPGLTIDRQVLLYPSLDYTLSQPSIRTHGEGYLLELDRILWMFDAYFQQAENRRDCSPLFMEVTGRYPATLLVTAGFDPLRDEGVAYYDRLQATGVRCAHVHRPGMVHAFLNLEDLVPEDCRLTYEAIGDFLNA